LNKPAWASFWLLGIVWGASFLLISVGIEEMSATQLVLIRTTIAAIGLNAVRRYRGYSLPRDWPTIRALIIIGIGNATVPYTLIALSEQNISSGMAAVLQSTAAFFSLITAHLAFADERMDKQKVMGLFVGFAGVVILSSDTISGGKVDKPMLLGVLGMVATSLCYSIFTVYSRKVIKRDIKPVVASSTIFMSAAIFSVVFVILEPIFGGRAFVPLNQLPDHVLLAAFMLGFTNTFIAYLFFYFIVKELGAFKSVMVTYIVPVVGLILGVVVLDEVVTTSMLMGATMIMMGIAVINVRPKLLFNRRPIKTQKVG
jgi:drug/metabolite transporter (DMT)-like permease